ncbi:MAG TPA: flagellar basal body P-ring formation chaperone FlgA [Ideonella sp.]|uniref:flagellar basal body P-ring formation chaperone FlgA n=1 Tax=Ideonella sp. TaxID=1929293 RepID=UPI002E2EF32D|nr:flagellar basal body P-ring formation chaperone FlgA [Ideonella sp.]HEX5685336.1 flagellar basal body P-ring formation chaperone FlgA [Ideonella sp.]
MNLTRFSSASRACSRGLVHAAGALAVLATGLAGGLAWGQAAAPAAGDNAEMAAVSAQVQQMARDSAGRAGLGQARIEVEVGSLDPRLKLAPCQRIEPYLPPGLPVWGRTRIGLKCTQGIKHWNVTLPVTVHVWARSLVTQTALPGGTQLGAEHFTEAEVDLAAAPGLPISQPGLAIGRTLSRPVAAGTALRQTDLKARQWFAAGETVRVVAVGPGWQVVTEGEAMSPGLEGHAVRIRTESGRLLQGRPVGDRRVEVAL